MTDYLKFGERCSVSENRTRVAINYGRDGLYGEYDPEDPEDVPLLKVALYRDNLNIAHAMTRIPAYVSSQFLFMFALQVLNEVFQENEDNYPPQLLEEKLKRLGMVGPSLETEMPPLPKFMLSKDVAEALNLSTRRVNKLITDGKLEGYQIGKSKMVSSDSLNKYLEEARIQPDA